MKKVILNRFKECFYGINAWIVTKDLLAQGKNSFFVYAWDTDLSFVKYDPKKYLEIKETRYLSSGLYDFISFTDLGPTFTSTSYSLRDFSFYYSHNIPDERLIDLLEELPENFQTLYKVAEIPEGEKYRILEDEYGSEYVELFSDIEWLTA